MKLKSRNSLNLPPVQKDYIPFCSQEKPLTWELYNLVLGPLRESEIVLALNQETVVHVVQLHNVRYVSAALVGDKLEQLLIIPVNPLHPLSLLDLLLELGEPGTVGVAGEEVVFLLRDGVDWDRLPGEAGAPGLVTVRREQTGQVREGGHQGSVRVSASYHYLLPRVFSAEEALVPLSEPLTQLEVPVDAPLGELTPPTRPGIVSPGVSWIGGYWSPVAVSEEEVDLLQSIQ